MKLLSPLFILLLFMGSACQKDPDPQPGDPREVPVSELLESPILLISNPQAPLAPLANIGTRVKTRIAIRVDGPVPLEKEFRDSSSRLHLLPVVGLYPGQINQIQFRIEEEDGSRYAVQTLNYLAPTLPAEFPEIKIEKASPSRMEPGLTFCELNIGGLGPYRTQPIAFDHQGVIRWYADLSVTGGWTAPFEPLRNGRFLYAFSWGLFECDFGGRETRRWGLPGFSQHHDAIEKPDGNFIVPVSRLGIDTWLDHIVEVGRDTGGIRRVWDLREVLDVDRYDLILNRTDWIHVNSVWYDERDQGLVISGRHQGVVKVSYDNKLRWILAPHQGWGKAGLNGDGINTADYLLTAVDAQGRPYPEAVQMGLEESPDFRWPWGQHAAMVLPDGHILMFDNVWHRRFSYDEVDYNRMVEYEVDEQKRTVRQVWQYGEERGPELYSPNISDVDFLPQTGNRLMISGNIDEQNPRRAKVVEVSYPGKEVIFEATILFRNRHSTGRGWEQGDMIYRGERVRW